MGDRGPTGARSSQRLPSASLVHIQAAPLTAHLIAETSDF